MASMTTHSGKHRLRRGALLLCLGAAAGAAILALPASAAPGDVELVSWADGPAGTAGDGSSGEPTISADGRYVAFESSAGNLTADDTNSSAHIFVRDLVDGSTTLVSRKDEPAGAAADDDSYDPVISADGRYVAFGSFADNLSADDNNDFQNVFLRDLVDGTTTLVGRADGPDGTPSNQGSFEPTISADGRYVAFSSFATNLSAGTVTEVQRIFVRDTVANTTTLVTRADGVAGAIADAGATSPSISGDGRYVAFDSWADNLSSDDSVGRLDVFVRDLLENTTTLASRADGPDGAGADFGGNDPVISGDGRHVAFQSAADNLSPAVDPNTGNVYLRDLTENTTTLVSRDNGPDGVAPEKPSISVDGRYVAFESLADNSPGGPVGGVFVRDLTSDTSVRVSDGGSPNITPDGRYVVFDAFDPFDVVAPADTNGFGDVFRQDLLGPAPLPPFDPATPVATVGTLASQTSQWCAQAPPPPAPTGNGTVALTAEQLRINQRIGSAAIRRAAAIQQWLDDGIVGSDICGGTFLAESLDPGIVTNAGVLGPLPAVAAPREVVIPPAKPKTGVTFKVTTEQLRTNQRIYAAAVRRVNALRERIDGMLTGGDITDGSLGRDRLRRDLTIVRRASASTPPAPSTTNVGPTTSRSATFQLTAGQLKTNQRIAAAAVRRTNELRAALAVGLDRSNFADGTITSADLRP